MPRPTKDRPRAGYEEVPLSSARQALAVAQSRPSREMTRQDILRELAVIGLSNITHYVIDEAGQVGVAAGAPAYAMRAVESIKRRVRIDAEGAMTVTTELTLWNKLTALRTAAQHLGMLNEKVEHSGEVQLVHKLAAVARMPDHELRAYVQTLREQKQITDGTTQRRG